MIYNSLCWSPLYLHLSRFAITVQVLVLLLTSAVSAVGVGPTCQAQTPAAQRAAGQPTEGRPAGQQPTGGPQQEPLHHRQQLQPERQSHMRLRRPKRSPFNSRNTELNNM